MNDHIADANKMVSDTPRTDEAVWQIEGGEMVCPKFCRQLERELNAANESFRKLNIHALDLAARIKRLEEAGDELLMWLGEDISASKGQLLQDAWHKAKEAKP